MELLFPKISFILKISSFQYSFTPLPILQAKSLPKETVNSVLIINNVQEILISVFNDKQKHFLNTNSWHEWGGLVFIQKLDEIHHFSLTQLLHMQIAAQKLNILRIR